MLQLLTFVIPLIFLISIGFAAVPSEEERLARRVQSHLMIHDYLSAVEESEQAIQLYPTSSLLYEGYIRSLAKKGDEKKLLETWEKYAGQFPDKNSNRELIEEMAWGILQKASLSSSIIMRDMSLLAAYFSQDAKGVSILHQGMRDPNYSVRAVAVKLAAHLRDHRLIEEVKRLFREEKVWIVRQQILEAIGKMKISSMKGDLEALIASDESTAAEKTLAIASMLDLLDSVNRAEVEKLSSSNRAGLRQLICQAIAHFQSTRDLDYLLRLTKDPHADVRFEAFQAIGTLRPNKRTEEIFNLAREGIQDRNYKVALSASWLLILYEPIEGMKNLEKFLHDERREVRLLAAAALSSSGQYGISLMLDQFRHHSDPFVRLNLAMGLIGQRQATEESAIFLREMLMNKDEKRWSRIKEGTFEAIINKPSANGPLMDAESDNQMLRLELLNLLAILKTPQTQEAVRQYLNERSWEIPATAAILLLMEGDESAIDIVKQLLQDHQPKIRLQAALILSLWSRDEYPIQVLEEGYRKSDWEMKTKILEGIGRIGSMRSIPFLIQVLKEPSQSLRLIGAMAIIQCLNH